MNIYTTDKIRNVVLLGHGGAGKTSLVEAMAYLSGITSRMGKVSDGNTVSDYSKEEQKRKFSINTAVVPIEWEGYKINLLDTPGYFDFVGEVEEAVAAAKDGEVIELHSDATLTSKLVVESKQTWAFGEYTVTLANGNGNYGLVVKGDLTITENDVDHVLLKSDGIPTYHFAHAVDDHLMRTTHVVRGDEWLPTLPFHIQLFKALGFKLPKYVHIGPLMKMDGTSKRKLSKRKDPELALTFYKAEGFPVEAVYEYIMTLLNSNYEDWRRANPDAPATDFKFSPKKLNPRRQPV